MWLHPKKPKGKWHRKRIVFSVFLLSFLFAGPHIRIGGEPLLLFNIIERKFVLFGQVFWPHDFHLFAIAMITAVVCITLFTVIFGRLFCGWACPQTVFMEMVFRKIEYLIEGDWTHQKRLKKAPWGANKILKKTLKHAIFWGISFLIANTFLAYIIGSKALWKIQTDSPSEHVVGLISLAVFTTLFYLVFAKLREQVCTTICPYGRLQGVLLDQNSLVVAYDRKRGEARSKIRKGEDRAAGGKGSCIDCFQCVHVCPTGIDIRNGTQLECTNCTACIDVCDDMMEKVGQETGLIKYASENNIPWGRKFRWSTKVKSYSFLLLGLIGLLVYLIATRSDFEATIFRQRGTTVRKFSPSEYSNTYDFSLVNKTNEDQEFEFELLDGAGKVVVLGTDNKLPKQGILKGKFLIVVDRDDVKPRSNKITIGVKSEGEIIEKVKLTFMGPLL